MKTSSQSILEHAHLIIMALTLVIFCIGSASRSQQISKDPAYAWFGYAPASIQPVMPIEPEMTVQYKDTHEAPAMTPTI